MTVDTRIVIHYLVKTFPIGYNINLEYYVTGSCLVNSAGAHDFVCVAIIELAISVRNDLDCHLAKYWTELLIVGRRTPSSDDNSFIDEIRPTGQADWADVFCHIIKKESFDSIQIQII